MAGSIGVTGYLISVLGDFNGSNVLASQLSCEFSMNISGGSYAGLLSYAYLSSIAVNDCNFTGNFAGS